MNSKVTAYDTDLVVVSVTQVPYSLLFLEIVCISQDSTEKQNQWDVQNLQEIQTGDPGKSQCYSSSLKVF